MLQRNDQTALPRLNAVRVIIVLFIALGYASTMPIGPGNPEILAHLGYDPSWIGVQLLFFFSGFLALRSIRHHGSAVKYLSSRFLRNTPLLIIFTLVTVLIIYPSLGVMSDDPAQLIIKLGRYFFETITCVNPGQVLPGLLDGAVYMCIIQGAIWTFRWGMIAHLATAIGTKFGLFRTNKFIVSAAMITTTAYFTIAYVDAKLGLEWLSMPHVGLRLAYPFLLGMVCFAYQARLPTRFKVRLYVLAAFGGSATLWDTLLPWTPAIEMLITAFWAYAAFLLVTSKTPKLAFMNSWPNLALALYLVNWPAAQLLLLAVPDISQIGLIALSLPISIAVAYATHLLVSGPAYDFAKSLKTKPKALA